MSDYKTIKLDTRDAVATLTLNRPDVLNAISAVMAHEIRDALSRLRRDKDVRALLLTGAGRGFCAGADLNDPFMNLEARRGERGAAFANVMDEIINPLMRSLYEFDRPIVSAVNGVAAGGGIGIALTADIVIAARSARFVQVFTPQLALIPDMGCTWHLARLVSRARALGLALLGDSLSAEEAEKWGLVWRVVENEALEAEASSVLERLVAGSPQAQVFLRKAVDAAALSTFAEQLDRERDLQRMLVGTQDFEEGVLAFKEKRRPRFTGT